jgi:hypothetical protein
MTFDRLDAFVIFVFAAVWGFILGVGCGLNIAKKRRTSGESE